MFYVPYMNLYDFQEIFSSPTKNEYYTVFGAFKFFVLVLNELQELKYNLCVTTK